MFSFDVTKFMIWTFPQGMDLEEFPPLLSLGFSSPTVDNEEPLSFGTLLACLNMALSNLGPVSFGYFYDVCACSRGSSTTSFSFFKKRGFMINVAMEILFCRTAVEQNFSEILRDNLKIYNLSKT